MTQDAAAERAATVTLLLHECAHGQWQAWHVAQARKLMGMTQNDLGRAIGYTRQGIGKIEAGSPVTLVFELAVRYLLEQAVRRAA